jgi:hypothetical protein
MVSPNDLLILYRNDFRAFLQLAFREAHPAQTFTDNWHLDVIAEGLMAHPPGSGSRLMLNVPPRSLKSFCVSIAWPLFLLARRRDLQITVIAGTQELAAELSEVRERLLRSRRLLAVFPNLRFIRVTGGLRFESGGRLTQTFIGRSQIGRGADVVIIDDPLPPSHVTDEGRRTSVNQWYGAEVAPRLNHKGSVVVIVMQRLHPDDLCGHLLGSGEAWDKVILSAVAKADERWVLANGRVYLRKRGEALCPARENLGDLKAKLRETGGRNFFAQYLQAPRLLPGGASWRGVSVSAPTPLPGYEHLIPPRAGFYRVNLTHEVLTEYFGHPPLIDRSCFREYTTEELEQQAIEQQQRLIADIQRDVDASLDTNRPPL